MKAIFKTTAICTSLALALSACSDKSDDKKAKQDGGLVRIEATKKMTSSELADAGEQLVTPYTWMLADRVFTMALQNNPQDEKAQFYRALLKPMMVYRGIGNRIKPFARQFGSIKNLEASLKKIPNSPLKDFLMDGPEDISTAAQIQDLLVQQREAFNDFRKFAKTHTDVEYSLYLNPFLWQNTITENAKSNCSVVEDSDNGMIFDCDTENAATMKVGSADSLAMAQMAAGYVLFLDMYTSYSVDGIETIYKDLQNPKLTQEQRQKKLESVPTLGKLRKDQQLSRILEMGSDLHSAITWAMQYQSQLCAKGEYQQNRPGYLMENGFCITDKDAANRQLDLLSQMVNGIANITLFDKTGQAVETRLNVRGFVLSPVQDLRSIAPASYCAGGEQPKTLRDDSMNGLYPNKDGARFTFAPCGWN